MPMSDYAIVNLLEIDDAVAGRVEGLEGGSAASSSGRATSA